MSLRRLPRAFRTLLPYWWSRLLFPARSPCATDVGGGFWVGLAALALVAGPLLFLNLSYPLLEPDEGRYAEVVREMVTSGDWVVPTLNRVPYFDKPPLFYWLVGGSFRAFGVNEAAARLVPTSAAFLTVLAVYVFGRRVIATRAAFLAGLGLSLTGGFVQCGRIVILDSLLTLFVTASLLTACEAVRGERTRWAWWLTSALCCALGVLTKGPVALVLLGPPVAAYVWLNRDAARLTLGHWAAYAGLVLGLVAPAYIALIARDPHFAYHFFVDQHLVRFLRNEYHVQPVWYYAPVLLVGCLPWSLLVLPVTRFLFSRSPAVRSVRPQALGFFLLWAGWCVLFFSASRGKLPTYMLPALPAIALVVGCYLDRVLRRASAEIHFGQDPTTVPRLAVITLCALLVALALGTWSMHLIGAPAALVQTGLCAACLAGAALWGRRLPLAAGWLLCGALGAVLTGEAADYIVPAWSYRRAPLTRSEEVRALAHDGQTHVVCYGGEWGSIPFYVGRDDLVFNCSEEGPEAATKFFQKYPRSLLVVRHKADLERFRGTVPAGMEITPLADAGEVRVVLVQAVASPGKGPGRGVSQPALDRPRPWTPRSN
ncbi:MAG TPA: glycosyltransferase family 39 protein [Gemmataceae bacterium]|jgi:dolichol-phosphate mannosyltransferase|nr:glycosyltransferase family 39 protein [Gemmataceae bacterium]